MGVVPMLQSEPFPHHYRSSVWGYIEGLSQIGNFITPFIVTACDNHNIPTLAVMGLMCAVLGITPMFFIKETLNACEDEQEEAGPLAEERDSIINPDDDDEGEGGKPLMA
jgi:hypothetical protein